MIRRVFEWDDVLTAICNRDVFGTRTLGYQKAYGAGRNEVAFYAQYIDERCVGVLSDAFGSGALTLDTDADLTEWLEFVHFFGLKSLLCDGKTGNELGFTDCERGHIMRYAECERTPKLPFLTPRDAAFSYREAYDLLCECGFALGGYETWLGDFALRVQRGAADMLCIREDVTAASASVLFQSSSAVYLGAVATHTNYRGRGYAGDLVLRLAQCGKRAEILCKPHRVTFYESLGFQRNGEFTICHFSK